MPFVEANHFIKIPSANFSLTFITYCALKLFQIVTTWLEGGDALAKSEKQKSYS